MVKPKLPLAISYSRWSSAEQRLGHSAKRQLDAATEYCLKNGLRLDDKLFIDDGVSAFRAKNIEEGALGRFREAVENGEIPIGSTLLVEQLDRLSRTTPRKAQRVLEDICEAGVDVVTLSDNRRYTKKALDRDPGALLMSLLIFIRANEESERKADLLTKSWRNRRNVVAQEAKPKAMHGRPPGWLKVIHEENSRSYRYEPIPAVVAVIQRIFKLVSEGYSYHRVAQLLTSEGVPTLKFKRKDGKLVPIAKVWHPTSIRQVITNRAVLGEYQPHTVVHDEKTGKKSRVPFGEPIKGYYPSIVSEALWEQVQSTREDPSGPVIRGRLHRRAGLHNSFAGLLTCSRCGGSMSLQAKFKQRGAQGKQYRYLVCSAARRGLGCTFTGIHYDNVEAGFERDLELILSGFREDHEATAELKSLEPPILILEERIGRLVEGYAKVADPAILKKLQALRAELETLRERERNLLALVVNTQGPVVQRRIQALKEALKERPRDARKVNACLRTLFTGLSLNPDTGEATLTWKGGGSVGFLFGFPR